MDAVDKTGYKLRVGQKVWIDYDESEATVLRLGDFLFRAAHWIMLETPRGRHEVASDRLVVIAPQPLEWVKFSDRRPTKLDCDITGDVYVRRQTLSRDWLYGFTSTLNSPTEWLSGVIDNIEFQTRKCVGLNICSSDVRQIEL